MIIFNFLNNTVIILYRISQSTDNNYLNFSDATLELPKTLIENTFLLIILYLYS